MPPKKATSKKAQTKTAASAAASVDANLPNNGVKDEPQELLTNGTSLKDVEDTKETTTPTTQTKVTKRSSGRAKNVANELETKAPEVSKKPAAKGRGGKKKSNENEVIENEVASEAVKENREENEEEKEKVAEAETNAEEVVVSKATKGKKKAETKTKASKKIIKTEETSTQEEQPLEDAAEAKVSEKKSKSRKKKVEEVEEEEVKIKEEIAEEKVVEEKVTKKSSRSTKKDKVTAPTDEEPPKKKGRTKKDKTQPAEEVEVAKEEIAEEVKEKKPAKRGRAAVKAVIEDAQTANGESEDVLPKKRSRKAPSVEKEVLAEKPKRGRGKKTDKVLEQVPEESSSTQGKEEDITNGQVKQEITEEAKETPKTNKKAETPQTEAPAKAKGGRKRAAPSTNNKKSTKKSTADDKEEEVGDDDVEGGLDDGVVNTDDMDEDEADESKPSKTKKKKTDNSASPLNATTTKYNKHDFELPPPAEGQTVEEPRFNLKISSWNVAGLRSWLKKEGLKFLEYEQPDIFCMQETKCTTDQLPEEVARIPGYHPYWLCMPGGYAGVAIYSKIMPINVEYGIGNKEFDDCGRIITAEYEKFFLINVYVPNSGRKLVNLEPRMRWEKLFQEFVKNLDSRKPVIICGDMNVSHQEIDLANPKTNTRNAGFTKEERDKMSELLAMGYVDTFRHLYPERKGAYTFWTYMGNARSRNVGWRLDYFIVSERFIKRVVDNCIRSQCLGSDHCPITLFLKL